MCWLPHPYRSSGSTARDQRLLPLLMLSTPLVLERLSEDQMRAQQPGQEHGKGFPGQVFAPTNLITPLVADTTAEKEEALHGHAVLLGRPIFARPLFRTF